MNEWITEVFEVQPLALPGSAQNVDIFFNKFVPSSQFFMFFKGLTFQDFLKCPKTYIFLIYFSILYHKGCNHYESG